MAGSSLPSDAPLLRRHTHGDGFGYGWLLVLILVSITFQLAAPETDVAQVITIGLQGMTLIAALHVSGVRTWLIHAAAAIAVIALLAAIGVLIGSGELDDGAGRLLGLLFVVLAPAAIIRGIVRQARRDRAITLRTMAGVLCVYLLIGSGFAFAYGVISAARERHLLCPAARRRHLGLPLLQLRHHDDDRLRRPHRRARPGALAGDHRGADRADLPGHGRGADRQQLGGTRLQQP